MKKNRAVPSTVAALFIYTMKSSTTQGILIIFFRNGIENFM